MIAELQATDMHNIVRLILPRGSGSSAARPDSPGPALNDDQSSVIGSGRYAKVARELGAWQDSGVLTRDPAPALYVYEYVEDGLLVRGLIGNIGVYSPEEKIVHPHEDVMPGPVADRFELMSTTRANLEPILLVYDGDGPASDIVERVTATTPQLVAISPEGSEHRIWAISDPADLEQIRSDLAPRDVLIADGHHRYATYRKLRDAAGTTEAGPWDFGLAMLVDQQRHPLRLGPIHRSLANISLETIDSSGLLTLTGAPSQADAVAALTAAAGARPTFALSDGTTWLVGQRSDSGDVAVLPQPSEAAAEAAAASTDVSILHNVLLPAWGIDERDIGYHHSAKAAVVAAIHGRGVAVLTNPPSAATVMDIARTGAMMPRKSTSWGPKPRMGLLMRLVDEPEARS